MMDVSFFRSLIGLKWQTRRVWSSPRVSVGGSYRILRMGVDGWYTPREEAPAFAVVRRVREEELGLISERDAMAEGGYSISEFKAVWRELHGEWDPWQEVYVVSYDTVVEDPEV